MGTAGLKKGKETVSDVIPVVCHVSLELIRNAMLFFCMYKLLEAFPNLIFSCYCSIIIGFLVCQMENHGSGGCS